MRKVRYWGNSFGNRRTCPLLEPAHRRLRIGTRNDNKQCPQGSAIPTSKPLMCAECDAHAGGEQQIVALQSIDRVGDVTIAGVDLPAEHLVDLGDRGGIEDNSVLAQIAQVGIELKPFVNGKG